MKSSKITPSCILILLGALCLAFALTMLIGRRISVSEAQKTCEQIVSTIDRLFPAPIDALPEERSNSTMPVLQVQSSQVAGILEFSVPECRLPIGASWQSDQGLRMPAIFSGSVYDRSLILGAVDEAGQIPFAEQMESGQTVQLIDLQGYRYTYQITAIKRVDHVDADYLARQDGDLTLFIKRSMAMQYIVVVCQLAHRVG